MKYVNLDILAWFQEGPGVRNYQYVDKGIKLINVTNLVNGQLKLHLTSRYISEEEAFGKYKHFLCDNGDLVIASSGITYETLSKKIAFVTEKDLPLCMNTSVIRFKPINHDVCIDYIYYFFKSEKYRNQISKLMTGSAQLNYGPSHLHKVKIPYYDIVKQTKIADELKKIDENISICYRNIDNLDNIVKSRFIEMFENKGFELVPIRELVDTKKISAKKNFNSEEEIKYIDISSIDNERNIIIGYTNYIMKDAPSRAQQCLRKNDILISTVRPNLRNIAIFKEEDLDYVGSSGFCILRAKKVNSDYLKYVVLNDKFTNAMVDLTTGASYPAIRDEDVLNYLMINAPLELQNTFANFVQQIDKSKFIVQKQIKLLEELLEKKMNEYFG